MMETRFLKYIPAGRIYEMNEAFRVARSDGARLFAVRVKGTFIDIGDTKSYRHANEIYTRSMPRGGIAARK